MPKRALVNVDTNSAKRRVHQGGLVKKSGDSTRPNDDSIVPTNSGQYKADDYNDALKYLGDENLIIPSPPTRILRMPYTSICNPLLRDVAIPMAKRAFHLLLNKGFIHLPVGPFVNDITRAERDEESCTLSIVYAIINTRNNKIETVGSTKNADHRKERRQGNGTLLPHQKMQRIFNHDLLTSEVDTELKEFVKELLKAFVAHPDCPLPLRRVYEAYLLRGGEKLGFFKNCSLQLIELGAKCHFKLRYDFEFLMFDKEIYEERQESILEAWKYILPHLEECFGGKEAEGKVRVKYGSSWRPGGNAMESIAGHPIDMSQTNMVDVAPYPGATHKSFMYDTKGYNSSQLAEGFEKFCRTVDSLEEYDFLDLDTCKFLFDDEPRASLDLLLREGWKIRVIVWNFEIALLQHPTMKKVIWLHLPYCKYAPGVRRPLEAIVKRNMAIQLSKLAVAWCQGELLFRAQMNTTFHDATLSAFAYEHAITACHNGNMQAAASARDIQSDAKTYALLQNDLYDIEDDMPMASNLRKMVYSARKGEEVNKEFDLNDLVIRRAVNVARMINQTSDVKAAVETIQDIFKEDGANYKAQSQRWTYFFDAFKPESQLILAIKKYLPKQNRGNRKSKGRADKKRQAEIDADYALLKKLQLGDKFWVRLKNTDDDPPEESERKREGADKVFLNLIFGSTKNHFNVVAVDDPRMINKWQPKKGLPATKSKNEAFVLCQLVPKAGSD